MGVDFRVGNMSYSRYDNLVAAIAECFKGVPNIEIPKDTDSILYPFGYSNIGENAEKKEKYIFNDSTPQCIKEFCNNPYMDLSKDYVFQLYSLLLLEKNNIHVVNENNDYTISSFLYSLKHCVYTGDDWFTV